MDHRDVAAVISSLKQSAQECSSNSARLAVYADTELFAIQVDKMMQRNKNDELVRYREELSHISSSLALQYVSRPMSRAMQVLHKLDEIVRLIAVWLTLMLSSVFFAIPCIILTPVDYLLVTCGITSVYMQIAVVCKLFLSRTLLRISGIFVVADGVQRENFGRDCVIACFSHSSSMDAFLTSATIPVTALTVVSVVNVLLSALLPFFIHPLHIYLRTVQEGVVLDPLLFLVCGGFRGRADQPREPRTSRAGHGGRGQCGEARGMPRRGP